LTREGAEGAELPADRAEQSSARKAGQHPGMLQGTGLFRNRSEMSERMLLRSILKGKGTGEREASRTLQRMDSLG